MKIIKEYDLKELSEAVEKAIKSSYATESKYIKFDILKAQKILDVLERMAELEGAQTNEFECHNNIENVIKEENNDWNTARKQMELHSKIDSNGNILRGVGVEALRQTKIKERNETLCNDCLMSCCCHVDCKNEHITKQMLGDLVKCFGKSYGKKDIVVCGNCKYKEQCEVLTKHE
nr:MAG TPA: hypothetical protein [Caudoviricetes sp.]